MYTILLAEAALELVPPEIQRDATIAADAKRQKRAPGEILLDSSRHLQAMHGIKDERKRGRPDISHFCSLLCQDSQLNLHGKLSFMIHTRNDELIRFHPETRIPRVYNRFCGLAEDLFRKRKIEHEGKVLLSIEKTTPGEVVKELSKKGKVFVLDVTGPRRNLLQLAKEVKGKDVAFVIGGFAHGAFSAKDFKSLPSISISDTELCAWTVVADVIAACEASNDI